MLKNYFNIKEQLQKLKRTNKHIHHLLKKPGADPIHTISYMNFNYPHTSPLKRTWEKYGQKAKLSFNSNHES